MQAALELVSSETNFSALSLRHVTRQAGVVPTAFYRHFDDMGALGLALVDNTFHSLREILHGADISALPTKGLVRHSVELFAHYVRDNRLLFQFLVKERFSGSLPMREAIHHQIGILTAELAAELAHLDTFGQYIDEDDLDMVAELVVNTIIALSERILNTAASEEQDSALMDRAERQLRLIFMGAGLWRSPHARDRANF